MKGNFLGIKAATAVGGIAYNYYKSKFTKAQTRTKKINRNNMIGPNFTRSKRKYGRYKARTAKRANFRLDLQQQEVIYRWQNVSRFGIGPGAQGIWKYGGATARTQPLHVMDLTMSPVNEATGPLGSGMYALRNDNTSTDCSYVRVIGQTETGVSSNGGQGEFREFGFTDTSTRWTTATLKWVDIKMNLYGSYFVPIKYKIALVRIHDEVAVFGGFNDGAKQKTMVDSMLKPMFYSNLLTNTGMQKKSYTIVKQWNYVVEPMMRTDAEAVDSGETYKSPYFKEVKIFYKADKTLKYDWHDNTGVNDLVEDAATCNTNQTALNQLHNVIYPTSRLYLVITASSSKIEPTTDSATTAPTFDVTKWAGSYDIVVRRKILYPS